LPPHPAVKAVVAVLAATELLVSPILSVEVHLPAVTQVVAEEEVVAAPQNRVWVSPAPKVRLVAISGVVVHQTVMSKSQRDGGAMMWGGIVMAVARQTIGQPVLVGVEMVRKPTIVDQREHALLTMVR
ncbi:MAG: hypothetical protein AAB612_00975, partial [Patescibacteria group bacterium]